MTEAVAAKVRKKDERILIQACIDQLSVACMPVAVRRKEEREKERKLEAEGKPVALKLQPFSIAPINDNWTDTVTQYRKYVAAFLRASPLKKPADSITAQTWTLVDNKYENILSLAQQGSRGQALWAKNCCCKPTNLMIAKLREWWHPRKYSSANPEIQGLKDILNQEVGETSCEDDVQTVTPSGPQKRRRLTGKSPVSYSASSTTTSPTDEVTVDVPDSPPLQDCADI